MRSLFKNPFNSPMRSPTAEEAYVFKMHLTPGALPYDEVTGVKASCSISGARYGIVNGVVSSFASNVPPVEDKGLRGCPAFTSYWSPAIIGSDVSHTVENGWNKITLTANTGSYTFVRDTTSPGSAGSISIIQAIIKRGTCRYIGFRARVVSPPSTVAAVFDFNIGNFTALNSHEKIFVKNIDTDTYHICIRHVTPVDNALYFSVSLCTSDGQEISTGGTIGSYAYFKCLTGTIGANITALGTPNPTSVTSYVSEAATSTTGTSFDLDEVTLTSLKKGLRGKAVGEELTNPTTVETQNIDANNYTSVTGDVYTIVSSGTYCQFSWQDKLTIGKTYEFLPTIIGTPIGSIKEQSTNTVLTHGVPIMVTATGTQIAVARATACNVSLRLSVREVQAQGHIELEFESNVDSGWLPSGVDVRLNILNNNTSNVHPFSFMKGTDNIPLFRLSDGTLVASVSPIPLTVGQVFKISLDYGTYTDGTQKMRLTVNGVKSSVVAFSGSFGSQDLRFFFDNTVHAGWIKNLSYSEKPLW